MIDWEIVQAEFRNWDGSLRDICVTPASLDDWRAIYPFLLGCPGAAFYSDGNLCAAPRTIEEAFVPGANHLLSIYAGRSQVNVHFFTEDEIEFDIDPREVTSQVGLDALLAFMRELGQRTQKVAALTPENQSNIAIISYEPKTDRFRYYPSANSPK